MARRNTKQIGTGMNRFEQLARLEVGWWKAHHRRQEDEVLEQMSRLYALQFNISYLEATAAVKFRVEATKWHDIAEEYEDNGDQAKADIYWKKAEDCLREHFTILARYQR